MVRIALVRSITRQSHRCRPWYPKTSRRPAAGAVSLICSGSGPKRLGGLCADGAPLPMPSMDSCHDIGSIGTAAPDSRWLLANARCWLAPRAQYNYGRNHIMELWRQMPVAPWRSSTAEKLLLEAIRRATASIQLFKVHPEFNGDVTAIVLTDGQVLRSAKGSTRRRAPEDDSDPIMLGFFELPGTAGE